MMRSHGTISMYQGGCRCRPCRDAKLIDSRNYRAKCGADSLVDTRRTLKHLARLRVSPVVIARITGLRHSTIYKIKNHPFIKKSTEKAILSVTRATIKADYQQTKQGWVPLRTVAPLLNDLKESGFSIVKLGINARHNQMQARNARRIERIYRVTGVAA